jgi:proline dehydrogenase
MRRLALRYIAGERLDEALAVLGQLDAEGFSGILDILGEGEGSAAHAQAAFEAYGEAARAVATQGLDAYVSVKPTHFGLLLGDDLAFELYGSLAEECAGLGLSLRVEMEDHTTTNAMLDLVSRLRNRHGNVGLVLQSRLHRTPADIDALVARSPEAAGTLDVRMVKGIYLEPATIAHVDPGPIADAFVACCERLWAGGARVTLATHDGELGDRLIEVIQREGISPERYEFQVLLGVQKHLWEQWKGQGHAVRVYVPYGPEWRTYSERRLKKNPQLLGHIMRNMFRR